MHRAALAVVTAAATGLLVACSSSGPETAPPAGGTALPAASTAPSLPFSYRGAGQSSSPTFHVASAGSYAVSWTISGSQTQPNCTVSLALVADDGTNLSVLPGVQLAPTDTKSDSTALQLSAGDWRFQEGGGCTWKVAVNQP